jgi:hypothetical protein
MVPGQNPHRPALWGFFFASSSILSARPQKVPYVSRSSLSSYMFRQMRLDPPPAPAGPLHCPGLYRRDVRRRGTPSGVCMSLVGRDVQEDQCH